MAQITRRRALSQGAVAALCAPAVAAAVPAGLQNPQGAGSSAMPTLPTGAVPAEHPDAALIGLCTEFLALDEQIRTWNRGSPNEPDEATFNAACTRWCSYRRPIADLPATTEAGRIAKLHAALVAMQDAETTESTARIALVRAALREAIGDRAAPAAPNPDAALIAACDELERLEDQINALIRPPTRIEDENEREAAAEPIEARQQPVMDTIATRAAQTLLGMQAKARALTAWAPDIAKPHAPTNDERMLASLLADLTGRAGA